MLSMSSSSLTLPLILRPVLESRNTPAWSTNGSGRSFAARTSATRTRCTSSRYPWRVSRKRRVCKCFEAAHTDRPSSLMMYPMPYPSAAVGPKPNSRSAGLPQFDVERIDVPRVDQPLSRKISGSADAPSELTFTSVQVSSSRRRRR